MSNVSIKELRQRGRNIRATGNGKSDRAVRARIREREMPTVPKIQHGNTTKFNQEVVDVLVAAVAAGNYFTTSANLAGIHVQTLYRWLQKGEEAEEGDPFREFYLAIMEAEAQSESGLVKVVRDSADTDYRAGLELLARRFPERWSTRQRHELTGEGGGPVELIVVFDSDEDGSDDD